MNSYVRSGAMITTSTVVMFALMYLNTSTGPRLLQRDTHVYGTCDGSEHACNYAEFHAEKVH